MQSVQSPASSREKAEAAAQNSHLATPPASDPPSDPPKPSYPHFNGRDRSNTFSSMPDTPAMSEDSSPHQSQQGVEDGSRDDFLWSPTTEDTEDFRESQDSSVSSNLLFRDSEDVDLKKDEEVQALSRFATSLTPAEREDSDQEISSAIKAQGSNAIHGLENDQSTASQVDTFSHFGTRSGSSFLPFLRSTSQDTTPIGHHGKVAQSAPIGGPFSSAFFPRSPNPKPVSPVTSATHIIATKARSISIHSSRPPLRFFSVGDQDGGSGTDENGGTGTLLSPTSTLTAEPIASEEQDPKKYELRRSDSVKAFRDSESFESRPRTGPSNAELTLAHARNESFVPHHGNWDSSSASSSLKPAPTHHTGEDKTVFGGRDSDCQAAPLHGDRPRFSSSFSSGSPYQSPTSSQLHYEATQRDIAHSSLSLDPRLVEFCSTLNSLGSPTRRRQTTQSSTPEDLENEIQSYAEKIRQLQISQARLQTAQGAIQPSPSAVGFTSTSSPSSPISDRSGSSLPLYGASSESPSSRNLLLTAQQQFHLDNLPQGEEREQALWNARNSGMEDGLENLLTSSSSGPSPNNRKLNLYKTERCRSWEEKGSCRYGQKCQFAHGTEELRHVSRHPKYKTEICRTFWRTGTCPYAKRCCFIHTTGTSPTKDEPVERAPLLARVSAVSRNSGNGFGSSSLSLTSSSSSSHVADSIAVGRDAFSSPLSAGSRFNGSSSGLAPASPSPSPISRQQSFNTLGTSASIYAPQSPISPPTSFNSPESHGGWPSSLDSFGGRSLQGAFQANERSSSGLGLQFSPVQSQFDNHQQRESRLNPSAPRRELSSIFDREARTVGFRPEGARHQASNSSSSLEIRSGGSSHSAFSSQEQLRRDHSESQLHGLSGFGFSPLKADSAQSQHQYQQPSSSVQQQPIGVRPVSGGNQKQTAADDKSQPPNSRHRSFTLPSFQNDLNLFQRSNLWKEPPPYQPQLSRPPPMELRTPTQAPQSGYTRTVGPLWDTAASTPSITHPRNGKDFFRAPESSDPVNQDVAPSQSESNTDYDSNNADTFGDEEVKQGFFNNGMFLSSN